MRGPPHLNPLPTPPAGAESVIVDELTLDYMRRELGVCGIPVIALPGCGHHLFLDEPLAFVGVRLALKSFCRIGCPVNV